MSRITCINPNEVREYPIEVGDSKAIIEIGSIPKDVYSKIIALSGDDRSDGDAFEASWLAAKYGVRGHRDLIFGDKTEVPFKTEEDEKQRKVVSDETLMTYQYTGFLSEVSAEALTPGSGDIVKLKKAARISLSTAKALSVADGGEKSEKEG